LIICGATAYPRVIDFKRFREIADEVGAFLLADVTHIAGLIVAGIHPSPIDHAHFTTTCMHKQLYGPRGGLLLIGRDYQSPAPGGKRTLSDLIQAGVFPMFQGTPAEHVIAAKARALARVMTPEFRVLARRIVANARALAQSFMSKGYRVIANGSDNHIVLVDVNSIGLSGVIAEKALEESNVIVNKNKIPGDRKPATIASGIRLGTNSVSFREMGPTEMAHGTELMDQVLRSVKALGDREYILDPDVARSVRSDVKELCDAFPIPQYPVESSKELSAHAHI
jgi:glycine hydroxymethyltransferase